MRLPEVTQKETLPADKQHVFDYLAETRGGVRLPFSAILNHPEVCYRVAHVGSFARFESTLPKDVTEIATLAAAREFDCRFEWAAHAQMAPNAGVRPEAIEAIGRKADTTALNDTEKLVVGYVRKVLRDHRVDEETWNAATKAFGDKGALELTLTAGYYAMLASFLNVLEIEPAAGAPQLP